MTPITAQQLAQIIGAMIVAGDPLALARAGVSTDTRRLDEGCVFFALRGDNFDANAFAPQALEQGAAIVVVSSWQGGEPAVGAVLLVDNTLTALQNLAAWWRDQLQLHVVALTGSNGKTSTKDFTASVLAQQYVVNATRGNLNNHIGLPLTVLATTPEHTAAVFEMGMNHAGEIAPLATIARPQIAIITNIGSAHIEFLGSREAIAREKAAIAGGLTERDVLIVPHDCDFLELITSLTRARIVSTGSEMDAVRAENVHEKNGSACFSLVIDGQGSAEVELPVAGRHMVANALLAAAAGHLLEVPLQNIATGLSQAVLTSGRLRRFVSRGITVFDDTYNANPESVIAGLETLAQAPVAAQGSRYAVLGRLAELGEHEHDGARRIGSCIVKNGLSAVAVGEGADVISRYAGPTARHFANRSDAADHLRQTLQEGDAVLFKGSRISAMELLMKEIFPTN